MEQWQQFQVMASQLVPSRGDILLTVTSQGWQNTRKSDQYFNAKQKHLGCKKVRGQSEATLQRGRRDQKV